MDGRQTLCDELEYVFKTQVDTLSVVRVYELVIVRENTR